MASSTLYAVLIQWKCTRTHHKLAFDALRHLRSDHAEAWRNLFLRHVEPYLAGTTAPDDRFGDFKNHVVHVAEKAWGGAPAAAEAWYLRTLAELKARRWKKAVYSAGILSHYYFDPLQTFHTAETPEAGVLRRPVDWAISQAYPELQQFLEQDLGGYPEIAVPAGSDWLSRMVLAGAAAAHAQYEVLVDHFDLTRAVVRPADGFDQECRDRLAGLLGHSAVGWARILDRMFNESEVEPPRIRIGGLGLLARMTIPIFWFTRRAHYAAQQAVTADIARELQRTGKVVSSLPDECRAIRSLHAEEVLKTPVADVDAAQPRPIGTLHGTGKPDRRPKPTPKPEIAAVPKIESPKPAMPARPATTTAQLSHASPIDQSPGIASKPAGQLLQAGIKTVGDLLTADPQALLKKVGQRFLDAGTVRQWQLQAELQCRVPGLTGQAVQLLVGSGVESAEDLATSDAETLFELVTTLAATSAGERMLRDDAPPTLADVERWIDAAQPRAAAA
ncbi:DUF4332 domain-containing protein [Planctellipticum variicoloris]|uniref:DUF4332 domain-containing protein n=1 Tax=Planctellipticum variicoloris TaxID=3064265 RepID=UPI0030140E1E|nr:DUF4332 domain-containing protein [Planctomycetaceae bacterium SH412]